MLRFADPNGLRAIVIVQMDCGENPNRIETGGEISALDQLLFKSSGGPLADRPDWRVVPARLFGWGEQ
jgi:hypothetical protein